MCVVFVNVYVMFKCKDKCLFHSISQVMQVVIAVCYCGNVHLYPITPHTLLFKCVYMCVYFVCVCVCDE